MAANSRLMKMATTTMVATSSVLLVQMLLAPSATALVAEVRDATAFKLDVCKPPSKLTVSSADGSAVGAGEVSRRLIDCFRDVLTVFDALAVEANQDRAPFVAPLLNLYRAKVREVRGLVKQILFLEASRPQLETFETIVVASRLLDEMVALVPLLNAPASVVSVDEKQTKTETAIESFKKLIKDALDAAGVTEPKVLIDTLLDKTGVLDEIIKALKPKKK
jgi:hypothetical protein